MAPAVATGTNIPASKYVHRTHLYVQNMVIKIDFLCMQLEYINNTDGLDQCPREVDHHNTRLHINFFAKLEHRLELLSSVPCELVLGSTVFYPFS
jgi:hypothetical protein